jgi:hypothetical protein
MNPMILRSFDPSKKNLVATVNKSLCRRIDDYRHKVCRYTAVQRARNRLPRADVSRRVAGGEEGLDDAGACGVNQFVAVRVALAQGVFRDRVGSLDLGVTFPAWGGRFDHVYWVVVA